MQSQSRQIFLVMVSESIKIQVPPFALMFIGSALKNSGFGVQLVHCTPKDMENKAEEILNKSPLFVGFSVLTGLPTLRSAEMSKMLKKKSGVFVVWGGVHPSLLPSECLREDYIDAVVVGEGEETTVELARALSNGTSLGGIKGIGWKSKSGIVINEPRPFIKNLDDYPIDFGIIDVEKYIESGTITVSGKKKTVRKIGYISSRGCPHSCGFCYNLRFNGRRWRGTSVQRVAEDIAFLKKKYSIDYIDFWDDNFFADKKRAVQILEKLKELGIFSGIEIRIDYITEELAKKLGELGVNYLLIGAESGSDKILKLINKGFTVSEMLEKIKILDKYDLATQYSLILGLPSETQEDFWKTLDFMLEVHKIHRKSSFTVGIYCPYPGTDLYDLAMQSGFKPPEKTEDWNVLDRWRNTSRIPWVDNKVCLNVRHFFSILSWGIKPVNSWISYRIKKRMLRGSADITLIILARQLFDRFFSKPRP